MKVRVRYFASLREALGAGETVEMPDGLTVAEARHWLVGQDAAHAAVLAPERLLRCALNEVLCHPDTPVDDGSELAFFPPVTGG